MPLNRDNEEERRARLDRLLKQAQGETDTRGERAPDDGRMDAATPKPQKARLAARQMKKAG
jgi:hypothetical protein